MNTADIKSLYEQYVITTYPAAELALVRGEGATVWDAEGRAYLDFGSGIAVTGLGHSHPALTQAIARQAGILMHVSNLFYNELQPQLARALSQRFTPGSKCFFCNSGAEANEGLFKLARLYGHAQGRHHIITMSQSFHGRTLATLTATGQTKYQQGFEPLMPGFSYAKFNDLASVQAALTPATIAILVEAIQGEGGVVPAEPEFMKGLRTLCDERDILLLCDEVQCGMGRTGRWFGFQHYVQPDAFSLAKGLAGGFPMGAIVAGPKLANVFQPGQHASTFGGNPLACAAALAVIETMENKKLLENAFLMGAALAQGLCALGEKHKFVSEVRGLGLMLGLVCNRPVKDFAALLRKHGLLTIPAGEKVLRFVPPLTIRTAEVAEALQRVNTAASEWKPA
jgi:predicted acetylornithine/succinylornithine family transaminase